MNKLTTYNLSVTLETDDSVLQAHLRTFLEKYYTVKSIGFSPKTITDDKVFIGKLKHRNVYQLHSAQFVHFYHHLKEINYPIKIDEKVDERDYHSHFANMEMRENWIPREDQIPAIDFLTTNPVKSKLIPLQTGQGKGLISLCGLAKLKKRTAIVVLSRFIEKFVIEIAEKHNATTKDVMVIQGSKALAGIIQMAKDGELKNNYLVFSAETIQSYISNYEEDPNTCIEYYGCTPMELFPLLGVGIMLNDETHMSFHLLFKIIIYTNVEYQIGLTATLISDDPTIRRMHRVVYPLSCVYGEGKINKYIDVYPIAYSIDSRLMRLIKTTNYGSTHYSHIAFEKSIVRKDFLLRMYYRLINRTIQDYYVQDYKEKDKLLIFVATVEFATKLVSYLKEKYPERNVKRYCQEDPYEDLINGEVIVTTVISAGTGVDVPGLRVCIQTVNISSGSSNLQSLGRLRRLNDRDVKFCYLYSDNIPKQKKYHVRRMELFKDYAATINLRRSPVNFQ